MAAAEAERVAGKVLLALGQPYQLDAFVFRSTASIGIALFDGESVNLEPASEPA